MSGAEERLRVAVVGGGLAGIAAALECAEAGADVTLYESRQELGGATFSIRRNGYWLDNGQHVALRCCSAYRGLLARIGVQDRLELQPRLRVPVLAPGGRRALLSRAAVPAPLHLAASLLRYRHVSPRERVAVVRAVSALRALDLADPALDAITFGEWLRAHGQSERAIDVLWDVIALPTLNLPSREASLALAAFVFRIGLLDDSDACDLAVPRVPLRYLHSEPAEFALRGRGVDVRLRTAVRGIEPAKDGFRLVLADRAAWFSRVVAAVPHHAVASLVPSGVVDAAALGALGSSPIVNVHLLFDRLVLETPFAAAVGSPVQWMFDRTEAAGVEHGQLISISISSAARELHRPQGDLVRTCVAALHELLPRARRAELLDRLVTREPRATFRSAPGSAALRPGAETTLPGLALAGAWTDTGWPATMEGAVRSGLRAAEAVLAGSSVAPESRRIEAAVSV